MEVGQILPVPLAATVALPAVLVEQLGHRGAAGQEGLQAAAEDTEGQPETCRCFSSTTWALNPGSMSRFQLHSQESKAQVREQGSSISRQMHASLGANLKPAAIWRHRTSLVQESAVPHIAGCNSAKRQDSTICRLHLQ